MQVLHKPLAGYGTCAKAGALDRIYLEFNPLCARRL